MYSLTNRTYRMVDFIAANLNFQFQAIRKIFSEEFRFFLKSFDFFKQLQGI